MSTEAGSRMGYETETTDEVYLRRGELDLLARVHRPVGVTGCPALVDAHGGAWRYFDRTVDDYHGRALAALGIVVVAVDFRQAPEHHWPDPVDDLLEALAWVSREADRFGVDRERIGLMGGSSGGHLALWAALRAGSEPRTGLPAPHVVVALWPIAEPLARYRYLEHRMARADGTSNEPLFDPARLLRAQERFFGDIATMDAAGVEGLLRRCHGEQIPPLVVVHPELDENVPRVLSASLVEAWSAAGAAAELIDVSGVGHGFVNFGGIEADRCIARLADIVLAKGDESVPPAEPRIADQPLQGGQLP